MKKTTPISAAIALSLGLPFLSSCDSGGQNNGSDIILSSRGYNVATLTANPGTIAEFPPTLASGETITLTGVTLITGDTTQRLTTPLVVGASTQIIIDNYRHDYRRDSEDLKKSFIRRSQLHNVDSAELTEQINDLVGSGAGGGPGSLAEVLRVPEGFEPGDTARFNQAEFTIIKNAIKALGHEVREIQTPFAVQVLTRRTIEFEATSTNATLTGARQITGTYTLTETWSPITVGAAQDDLTFSLGVGGGAGESETGTFVVQLNSLTQG